jgi:hypothetical protein
MTLARPTAAFEPASGELYTGIGAVPRIDLNFQSAVLDDSEVNVFNISPENDFTTAGKAYDAGMYLTSAHTVPDYNAEIHQRNNSSSNDRLTAGNDILMSAVSGELGLSDEDIDMLFGLNDPGHGRKGHRHGHNCKGGEGGRGEGGSGTKRQQSFADELENGRHEHDHAAGHTHEGGHVTADGTTIEADGTAIAADGTVSQTNQDPAGQVAPAAPAPDAAPAASDPAVVAASTYRPSGASLG